MVWLKGRYSDFQLWPARHVAFERLKGLADTASEFGLAEGCIFSCTIVPGREETQQFRDECELAGERPDANYGFVMVSTDRREAHTTLTVPDDKFEKFYNDLLTIQPAEIELEFGITALNDRMRSVRRGLVSGEFRIKARKLVET